MATNPGGDPLDINDWYQGLFGLINVVGVPVQLKRLIVIQTWTAKSMMIQTAMVSRTMTMKQKKGREAKPALNWGQTTFFGS